MTITRIAGTAYDARHQSQVKELARIHTYATRIRHLARKATNARVALACREDTHITPTPVRPEHGDHARPTAHRASSSSFQIAS